MTFAKPKQYCKLWRCCPNFKRSECNDDVIDTENCDKYKERKDKENDI